MLWIILPRLDRRIGVDSVCRRQLCGSRSGGHSPLDAADSRFYMSWTRYRGFRRWKG
jgi:hypothetical protein